MSFEVSEGVFNIQRNLSKAQAFPVIGLPVSAVKLVVSVAEVVSGIAIACFASLGLFLSGLSGSQSTFDWSAETTMLSLWHVFWGSVGAGYSIANISTLGMFGFGVEFVVIPIMI